ncbi:MAG TPA: choice-of-anchor Q domain-containing protein [Chthoniobacterales bacterium]
MLVASAAFGWLASSDAAVITVTNTADNGAGSFRQTIADAQENDTINFAPDVRGTIALMNGELLISKALTIQGPGANLLTIDARNASRVLRIDAHGRAVSIFGLTFTRGQPAEFSPEGGGIRNDSNLTLTACTVSTCGGSADFGANAVGGGIYNATGSSIQLVRCTLNGNGVAGGGSFHLGQPGSGYGGALENEGMASLQNCTITGNTAVGGPMVCGIFGCMAGSGRGAGIYNAGDLVIAACTISSNSATADLGTASGGGIWSVGNSEITNSIVAENTGGAAPDAAGSFESDGFNLIGRRDGSAGFTAIGDQTGTIEAPLDPKLGPLQDNGGPTWTRALLPGSPAIDAGISANLSTDQRGGVRTHDYVGIPNPPGGDGTDIGSFEVGGLEVRLGNISTRLRVGTSDNAMIGGFIITGTQPKTVIVRGIGPSLPVPGALADPVIEVHGSSGELLATNDNWRDDPNRQHVIDSGLAPTNDLESALWGIINPGAYTVVVRGNNNATGVGLFEVYDLDGTVDSKLGNISTRGFVDTGDNVMIGGTIIIGSAPTTMLLRAIGPSLTNFGVPNALQDPTLELHDGNGALIAANDNWRSDQEAEIIATTIPPSNDLESAIVRDLVPGSYTAIVRGKNNTTGVALVEVYGLQ